MSAQPTPLPSGDWVSDRALSSIGFSLADGRGGTFSAHFEHASARLTVAPPRMATLVVSVRAASVTPGDAAVAAWLASPAVFDAARHPRVRFESASLERLGRHIELDGRLTIRRCTLAIAAVGTLDHTSPGAGRGDCLRLALETRVDRRQFGLDWPPAQRHGTRAAGTEVRIRAHLALRRAHALDPSDRPRRPARPTHPRS